MITARLRGQYRSARSGLQQYQKNCGSGRKFTITYANQVVINSTSFSAGGDSGSLIVTSDTSQRVAPLYAGSSSSTIAPSERRRLMKMLGGHHRDGAAIDDLICVGKAVGGEAASGHARAFC